MRSRRSALVAVLLTSLIALAGLVLLGPATPASASGPVVSVQNYSFTPALVTVPMGGTVTWEFHALHSTTSNQMFWDSGHRGSGSYAVVFRDAGTFGYHCMIHPEMTGRVRVPMTASGRPAAGYRLRWTVRTSTPSNRRFDIWFKRSGATSWSVFRSATATHVGFFNPARAGTYLVRARTRNVGVGASGWSPVLSLRIS